MPKTLIIVAHPNIEGSQINKRWIEELKQYPEEFTVRNLYAEYPDGVIDVETEQYLIKEHDNIVLQFPVYWFNCPPLLKQWLDEVLAFGWAYGPGGTAFHGKRFGIAVSLGGPADNYKPTGAVGYTLEETLRPFLLVGEYIGAMAQPPHAFYGALMGAESSDEWTREVGDGAERYLEHLRTYYI